MMSGYCNLLEPSSPAHQLPAFIHVSRTPNSKGQSRVKPHMELRRPQIPKLATIVVRTKMYTYVDGVPFHEESKQQRYLQDIFIDCPGAFPQDMWEH